MGRDLKIKQEEFGKSSLRTLEILQWRCTGGVNTMFLMHVNPAISITIYLLWFLMLITLAYWSV